MRSSLVMLALVGCINNPVPTARTLPPERLPTWTHGMWAVVETRHGTVAGELLSIDIEGVNVLIHGKVATMTLVEAERITLATYRASILNISVTGALATLSTLATGKFLPLTASAVLTTWFIGQKLAHDRPLLTWPGDSLDKLRPFARFPQGMPAGFQPENDRAPPWWE